jgi:hypothetical protein
MMPLVRKQMGDSNETGPWFICGKGDVKFRNYNYCNLFILRIHNFQVSKHNSRLFQGFPGFSGFQLVVRTL